MHFHKTPRRVVYICNIVIRCEIINNTRPENRSHLKMRRKNLGCFERSWIENNMLKIVRKHYKNSYIYSIYTICNVYIQCVYIQYVYIHTAVHIYSIYNIYSFGILAGHSTPISGPELVRRPPFEYFCCRHLLSDHVKLWPVLKWGWWQYDNGCYGNDEVIIAERSYTTGITFSHHIRDTYLKIWSYGRDSNLLQSEILNKS